MSNIGNHSLSIGWLVPAVEPGQGGLRNIFRICRQLSNFGHNITAYCEPSSAADTDQSLAELIHTHYGPLNFAVRAGQPREQLFDVLVATFWRTARNVLTYPYTTGRAYLVQDFEPYFYPMGDDYLAAEFDVQVRLKHRDLWSMVRSQTESGLLRRCRLFHLSRRS